ncbi:MAG: hypothetical protein H7Y15_08105 [Pseudonocardia sp.]|nr:hypothetical protein [Pseudonocardia sp.]
MSVVDLDDFLESRLAEDELCAWAASPTAGQEEDNPPELLGDRWVNVDMGGSGTFAVIGLPRPREDLLPLHPPPIYPPLGGLTAQLEDHALLSVLDHVARHHPSRITSQVAGGRELLHAFRAATPGSETHAALHLALRAIAVGHADHPDFNPAWRLWSADQGPWPT